MTMFKFKPLPVEDKYNKLSSLNNLDVFILGGEYYIVKDSVSFTNDVLCVSLCNGGSTKITRDLEVKKINVKIIVQEV